MAADHETKIRITGDSKSAIGAVTNVVGALNKLRSGIGKVFKALGTFNFAIQGIQTVISMVKTVGAWLDGIIHKAERLQAAYRDKIIAKALEDSISGYKKLNSEIEKQIQLQKDLDAALRSRLEAARELNDAQLELKHQKDVATLDPGDKDYAKKRSAIDSAYANAQAERNAGRQVLDAERNQKSLEDELKRTKEDIRKLEGKLRVIKNVKPLTDDKEKIKSFEAEEAKIKADLEKAIAARDQLKRLLKIAPKAIEAAKTNAEAARLRSENSRQDIAAQESQEAERKRKEEEKKRKDAKEKLEDAQLQKEKEAEIAALDVNSKDYADQKRAIEQKYAQKSAYNKMIRAGLTPEAEAEYEADEARRANETREYEAEKTRKAKEDYSAYLDRVAGVADSTRPSDRLTAMGLGSGAMRDPLAEKQAKDIATIAKEVVKIAHTQPASTTAETTYAP